MSIEDIENSFNKTKDAIYNQNFQRLALGDLAALISKPLKSKEEINHLLYIFNYMSNIKESLTNLGQKILEMNTDVEVGEGLVNQDRSNLELHTRDIIIYLDQFVDSIAALNRVYDFEESKIELNIMEVSIKTNRESVLRKAKEYRLSRSIGMENDQADIRTNYLQFLNEIIDVVIKDGVRLSVLKIYGILKKDLLAKGLI